MLGERVYSVIDKKKIKYIDAVQFITFFFKLLS